VAECGSGASLDPPWPPPVKELPPLPFEFFDHTGDLGITVTAPTREELFAAACLAFTAAITEPERIRAEQSLACDLRSADLETLLVDWLSELVYRFDVDQWFTRRAVVAISDEDGRVHARATLHGERFDPARHAVKVLIKGVTYHKLSVRQTPDGWTATVVFDI